MSKHSSKHSGSSGRGFMRAAIIQGRNAGTARSNVQTRHPEVTVTNNSYSSPGRMMKPTNNTMMSPAVRELNKDGFVIYNIQDVDDIYISVPSESADFGDDELNLIKMEDNVFVGGAKNVGPVEVKSHETESVNELQSYTQPADIFSIAIKRDESEEIDFNEIIVKNKKESDIVSEVPAYDLEESKMELGDMLVPVADTVCATSVAIPNQVVNIPITYEEPAEYSLDNADEVPEESMDTVIEESVQMDAPSNLYTEGNDPINMSLINVGEEELAPIFGGCELSNELAETSEAMQMIVTPSLIPAELVSDVSDVSSTELEITEIEGTESVIEIPDITEIQDDSEMLLVVVPRLYLDEQFLIADIDTVIPDDGLESYDAKFDVIEPKATAVEKSNVSFSFAPMETGRTGTTFSFSF